jgi:hypothetical protein
LQAAGQPVPKWILGGGTALMLHFGHRLSKDIDAFIDDPQYLAALSPRLNGDEIWACNAYQEAPNHLRLAFVEGEIDFIVAAAVTALSPTQRIVELPDHLPAVRHIIAVEHPVETALKKLNYRGAFLKGRDIFDVGIVDVAHGDVLREHLDSVSHMKSAILSRLGQIRSEFLQRELNELDIADRCQADAGTCLDRMREIATLIPDPE